MKAASYDITYNVAGYGGWSEEDLALETFVCGI